MSHNQTRNPDVATDATGATSPLLVALAGAVVAVPLFYGLWQALLKASKLFA